ncbi:MAG: energy transducer TonB [Gemmatimonadaceae bacterium]
MLEVLEQFVVDSTGFVLPGSLRVLRSTDSLFTQAVRAGLPNMRFVPPEMNGRKVRQLVQQPYYYFEIAGSAAGATRKAPPMARPTSDPANRNPMPLQPIFVTAR